MAGTGREGRGGSPADLRGRDADVPAPRDLIARQFGPLFAEHNITEWERRELVYFLAAFRYRKTLESLL